MPEFVSVAKVTNDVQSALNIGLDQLRISVDPQTPILIKPNLCCVRTCETGATTDPRVVEALIKYFKRRFQSERFYIIESDATMLNADVAFQILGYNRLARETGSNIVNLSKTPWKSTSYSNNVIQKRIRIPELLLGSHFLISVAKMKTSDSCGISATLKNMFGCNPEPYKLQYHRNLHQNIVDFAAAFRPSLSVVDGIIGMEGSGPVSGTPIKVGIMLFGTDPVATDHAVARVMRVDPRKVRVIKLAQRQGLGTCRYNVLGVHLDEVAISFKGPTSMVGALYSSKPFSLFRRFLNSTSDLVGSHGKK